MAQWESADWTSDEVRDTIGQLKSACEESYNAYQDTEECLQALENQQKGIEQRLSALENPQMMDIHNDSALENPQMMDVHIASEMMDVHMAGFKEKNASEMRDVHIASEMMDVHIPSEMMDVHDGQIPDESNWRSTNQVPIDQGKKEKAKGKQSNDWQNVPYKGTTGKGKRPPTCSTHDTSLRKGQQRPNTARSSLENPKPPTPQNWRDTLDPGHHCGYCRHYGKPHRHHYLGCKPRQQQIYGEDITRKLRNPVSRPSTTPHSPDDTVGIPQGFQSPPGVDSQNPGKGTYQHGTRRPTHTPTQKWWRIKPPLGGNAMTLHHLTHTTSTYDHKTPNYPGDKPGSSSSLPPMDQGVVQDTPEWRPANYREDPAMPQCRRPAEQITDPETTTYTTTGVSARRRSSSPHEPTAHLLGGVKVVEAHSPTRERTGKLETYLWVPLHLDTGSDRIRILDLETKQRIGATAPPDLYDAQIKEDM